MGSSLERFIAGHGGGTVVQAPPPSSALEAFLAQHGQATSPHDTPGDIDLGRDPVPPTGSPHPSLIDQVQQGVGDVGSAIAHPVDTIIGLGKGIAKSAHDAFAPVAGTREGSGYALSSKDLDQIERASGHPLARVTKDNTPDAVTPGENLRGIGNTVANVGLAVAPALSLLPRLGVNTAIGAANTPDEPLRGAVGGALLGEALHGVTHALGEGTGLATEAAKPVDASSVRADLLTKMSPDEQARIKADPQLAKVFTDEPLTKPVPVLGDVPAKPQMQTLIDASAKDDRVTLRRKLIDPTTPVEPGPDAATISAGGGEPDALDKLIATRQYLEPRGRLDDVGDIGRRPANTLPIEQRLPVEPPPAAQTVSYGGRVLRRPGGQLAPPEVLPEPVPAPSAPEQAPPVEQPNLQTYSTPEPPPTLQPLVSSNGTLEARPGVLRKVNADIGPTSVPAPRFTQSAESPNSFADPNEVRSFEGVPTPEHPASPPPISDLLNVAKLNLADESGQARIAQQLEQYRSLRDSNKQSFADADVNRAQIVKELTGGDPLALAPDKAKRLSGEELLARRDVVSQNDDLIGSLSKQIESRTLSPDDHQAAVEAVSKAVAQNDALLSDLVTGSSQKGRDLNLLRRIANRDLDPATWLVQAKRMLGDRPLTDDAMATVRKLVQDAADACGGSA